MTHDESALAALLDGELGKAEAAEWDTHLLTCHRCWAGLEEARRGRALARSLRATFPVALRERVEMAVGVAPRPRPSRRPRQGLAAVAAGAAAVLALAAAASVVADHRRDGVHDPRPIAAVLRLAADGSEELPPAQSGIVITRLHVKASEVVLARADQPFPMPQGAIPLGDDSDSPWLARRREVSLLCFSHPAPMLLAGRASPQTLTEVASALRIAGSAGNQDGARGVPLG